MMCYSLVVGLSSQDNHIEVDVPIRSIHVLLLNDLGHILSISYQLLLCVSMWESYQLTSRRDVQGP